MPDFRTNLALAILHDMFNPADVIKARRTTLLGSLQSTPVATIPIPVLLPTSCDGLKAAAIETRRLHGTAVNFELLQLEVAVEIDRMRLLESQLGKLGREIKMLYSKLHPSDALRTIPGSATPWRLSARRVA